MLQAADAMRKVKFFAHHDALTELHNRLLFDELAQRSWSMALRRDSELALLALDLEGFKAFNDSLGHSMGDEVLNTVARRIVQTIRGSDVAARIGGGTNSTSCCPMCQLRRLCTVQDGWLKCCQRPILESACPWR